MKNTYNHISFGFSEFPYSFLFGCGGKRPFLAPLLLPDTLSDVPISIYEPAVCFTGRALWMEAHEKEKSKVLGGIFREVDMCIMRWICVAAWKKKASKLFLFVFSLCYSESLCVI